MNTLKLYLRSMKMLVRCQTEYPLSFLLNTLSQLIMLGGEMLAVVLLFDRFPSLGQWTGENVLFFFGLISTSFYLVEFFCRGITNFSPLVRSGALDHMLLRPRGVMTQVCCAAMDPRRIGALAVGAAALAAGAWGSGVVWTVGKGVLLLESIACGSALVAGLFLIEAVCCLYAVRSPEAVNVLTYGGRSACQYPIDIYPRPLRVLFVCVAPFALTTHAPAAYILEKPLLGLPGWAAYVVPLAGAAFLTLMYFVFRRALKDYRSTGS